ncbi:CBM9 family sugar-binding protein [Alteromonas ponticola]|uniref:CBM9 family sugar-binding protein n=1 Tax=Alteromonas aquimaris TaxID=2998417 RepID=A0ABT3PAK9_9ALTE|nr:sugar-binding protein [Alteromonas aquimaris]MCW8109812.1 CBM9 family sugar-binding protein [Alteromonas aquimaris]
MRYFTPFLVFIFLPMYVKALGNQYTADSVVIDGVADEAVWEISPWHSLNHHITGTVPTKDDFWGRFKLAWNEEALFLIAEIVDDVVYDRHPDPLVNYWDDDCLEIFIDEDASGGEHLRSYNAFAYHLALDGSVVDIGEDGKPVMLNEHIESAWRRSSIPPYHLVWEAKIKVFPDTFTITEPGEPVRLAAGKTLGFMLAYCDNDGSETREHFMGSHDIRPVKGDKNLGYKTASVFGTLKLMKSGEGF